MPMGDFFSKLSSDEIMPIVIVAIIFGASAVIALAGIVASCVYKIRQLSISAHLKQDMLDRGMSAEEIKMILESRQRA
jgi:Na+/H+-dicarboxylate symporter